MIALVIPPGWTLHPGGTHIALPLLRGYLMRHGIEVSLFDLNVGSVEHYNALIRESEVVTACADKSAQAMNETYFGVEDRLNQIAASFGGKWFAHEGYQHLTCDLGDPESVREHSLLPSPFTHYFREEIIPRILKSNPRIIGMSLYVPSQLLPAFELTRLLRAAGYEGFIAMGGNMISRIIQDMQLPWVFELIDGLVSFQGECALRDIYRALENQRSLETIPNLTWRREDGTLQVNKTSLLKPPEFAPPDFDGLPHDSYWGAHYFPMIGARGCYYCKCSFCAIPFGWGPGNYIGMSPGEVVVKAMNDAYARHGVTRFKFVDEAIHPKMLQEMDRYRSEYAADFVFEGYVRFDPKWTDPKFLQLCQRIGMRKAYLGLELAPSKNRGVLSKADEADPREVLRLMSDVGIKTHIFSLFGFPGTGLEEAISTVEFALHHAAHIDTFDIFPFYYARHTNVQGVKIVEEPRRSWRTEHTYVPDADNVMQPEDVRILADRMSDIVWEQHPHWLHPLYRMFSPWHTAS